MANDWIKLIKGLEKKREVIAMAIALKPVGAYSVDCELIAYKWAKVWGWADCETIDGHISGLNGSVVDDIAGLPGFFAAAEVVGWARSTDRGITFTNWDRHNGNGAKARALAANRQQSARDKPSVTLASRSARDENVTREEKRREDVNAGDLETRESPPEGRSLELWNAYPAHRRDVSRKKLAELWKSRGLEPQFDAIMAGLERWKASEQWADPKYVKSLSAWMNQERWLNEPTRNQGAGVPAGAGQNRKEPNADRRAQARADEFGGGSVGALPIFRG